MHIHLCAGWYVCIIYTLGVLCSPGEHFTSINNGSISRNRYRGTKFWIKWLSYCSPVFISVFAPQLTTNLTGSIEKQLDFSFCSVTIVFHCELGLNLNSSLTWPYMVADGFLKMLQKSLGREIQWVLNIVKGFCCIT